MALDFGAVLSNLEGMGFFEFVLPWLLFLIIIHAVLVKTNMFDLKEKKSAIIAAIISFFIINFSPVNIGAFLTEFFGYASMYIAALLVFILFIGMGGYNLEKIPGGTNAYILILFLIAVIIFNGVSPGGIPFLDLSTENITILFVLALIVGVVWILGSEEKEEPKPEKR